MGLKFYEEYPQKYCEICEKELTIYERYYFMFFSNNFGKRGPEVCLQVLRNVIYQSQCKSTAVSLRYHVFCVREKNNNFKNIFGCAISAVQRDHK